MADKRKEPSTSEKKRSIYRLRWTIGTPYFVQGTKKLTEIPTLYFIKFDLGLGDAGGQLFDSLLSIGWMLKPIWGYLSDEFPLFGYKRKSWYILMAFLGSIFWFCTAFLSYSGVIVPLVYMIGFNLAFGTYAFIDVVTDALMVTEGQRLKRVGAFVNFQWIALSVANAIALFLGGWLQENINNGVFDPWLVFFLAGIPPLFTAFVGFRFLDEDKQPPGPRGRRARQSSPIWRRTFSYIKSAPSKMNKFRRENRVLWLLVLFIFFWKFSPSVGFIERSYLIDERGFTAKSFGLILSVGGLTFLSSVLAYRWLVFRFKSIDWHEYLYAMVALGVISFPLSFYFYLDPGHPWWRFIFFTVPDWINPLPDWNRYQWFRLINGTIFSFATIPAFLIPLTINGCTIRATHAAVGYAFLTALANATNIVEDVVGAGLFELFSSSAFLWLRKAFSGSIFDFAGSTDDRTLILEMFVYISLFFTLMTIPFIEMLRRELKRQKIQISLSEVRD